MVGDSTGPGLLVGYIEGRTAPWFIQRGDSTRTGRTENYPLF
jgi:hypothetical protein